MESQPAAYGKPTIGSVLAGLLLPPSASHPFLILHPAPGEIYESEIGLCHTAAPNTSVTPTALQTGARFLTIATRSVWDGHCCSCNPSPTMPPSSWGTPKSGCASFPGTREALSCLKPSAWFRFPSPHCQLIEASHSLWSQLKWYFLWDVFPNFLIYWMSPLPRIIISHTALHFSFLALITMCNHVLICVTNVCVPHCL